MSNFYILGPNGTFLSEDELYHYGVLGIKWGVHRSAKLSSANSRLQRKALKYDVKSAGLRKKSEKQHAVEDLDSANKAAIKAAKQMKKAANIRKSALKRDDYAQVKAEKRASKLEYKASKNTMKSNRLSKSTGYGIKAMKYSIKSDKVAAKAAKARAKMSRNTAYISMMNKRMSSLDKDKLRKVEEPLSKYLSESLRNLTSKPK